MKSNLTLKVNGQDRKVNVDPEAPLLYVLRNKLELNGPKFGCGLGQCGACMVLLEGRAVMSCQMPVRAVGNKAITTLEGLINEHGALHKVQSAFIEEQAAQCGYCLNGMVIAAVSLLNTNPNPDEAEICGSLQLNICRCGVHPRVLRAVKKAIKA